jgi:hypothetical protein
MSTDISDDRQLVEEGHEDDFVELNGSATLGRRLGSFRAAYHWDNTPNESSSDVIHTGGLAGPEYSCL